MSQKAGQRENSQVELIVQVSLIISLMEGKDSKNCTGWIDIENTHNGNVIVKFRVTRNYDCMQIQTLIDLHYNGCVLWGKSMAFLFLMLSFLKGIIIVRERV